MKMTIVDRPKAVQFIGLRHEGPHSESGPVFHRLAELLTEMDLWGSTGMWAGLRAHRSSGTSLSFAACAYPDTKPLPAGFERVVLPAGRYARLVHKGPLGGLPEAWSWCESVGLPALGASWTRGLAAELFLDDPDETPPEDCRTEILIPID